MRLFIAVGLFIWMVGFFAPCGVFAEGTSKEAPILDVEALKESVAMRTQLSWGERDERFKDFGRERVRVIQQIPIQMNGFYLFAVKVKLVMPPPDTHEEQLLLVVDARGRLQFADVQDLSTGRSLMDEPLGILRHIDNLPKDFGNLLFTGKGRHEMVVISDPFCPYCRKGWHFLKEKREKMKTLRLAHFPLNRISEVACLALEDAKARGFKVMEMVDFAYEGLNFVQEPQALLQQFIVAFPELKKHWGEDGNSALAHLESRYLEKIRKERMEIQALGISSTPVFFVDGKMVEGFQAEKLGERLQ
ncbi:DsbA family protein [Desulfobotulus sp.]|uniref:DsbA family protein n=1 Tax=Desulfobotulus sp. TaxID=1940337 RepID=UPI002A35AB21|nr:thioredoxin domain-containing protein [Desulfobotulus sp.]MDY0163661.1 thioredoxin domain-containing protein [Desulfobotulus sp.]